MGVVSLFLSDFYHSVEVWGWDKEIMEVGWLIGNLIGKSLAMCWEEELRVVVEWVGELVALEEKSG